MSNTNTESAIEQSLEQPSEPGQEAQTAQQAIAEEAPAVQEPSESSDLQEDSEEQSAEQSPEVQTEQQSADEAKSDDQSSAENASTEAPAPPTPQKKKRRALVISLAAVALILLLIASAVAVCAMPQNVEVGQEVKITALENIPALGSICKVKTDISAIDTSVIAKHDLELEFFGFLPITSYINVCDTIAPLVQTKSLYIPLEHELTPEDFVVSVSDATEVTLSFSEPIDTKSSTSATLIACDEGGNTTLTTVEFTVDPELSSCTYELGMSADEIKSELLALRDFDELELDRVTPDVCGTYPVRAKLGDRTCLFHVDIVDTTPPSVTAKSFDLLLGQKLSIKDFILHIEDKSEVTLSYISEPDFEKAGTQNLKIQIEDTHGNVTVVEPVLNILNIPSKVSTEIGTPMGVFIESLQKMIGLNAKLPEFSQGFKTENLRIGTHRASMIGQYGMIELDVEIVDTHAPTLSVRSLETSVGVLPAPTDFITNCSDRSPVGFSYENKIDVSQEGRYSVTIIATDEAGNQTKKSAILHVVKDKTPPVIYGIKNITAYEGDSISYRQGVYAMDDKDGKLSVTVDASKVKRSVVGTYTVYYTATDSNGNTATASAKVTIKAINQSAVNSLADQVLSKIIKTSMTERQKARAIYDWCTKNIKYSTSTSHLMGYFNKAAYSGFKLKYGNCYTYYAVASALLTRAGITNQMIQRNNPNEPHYWNLVKIGGSWYHFDTCPQPAPHKLEVFLLTTKQLQAFTKAGYYSFSQSKYPKTPN